jgi:serine protease
MGQYSNSGKGLDVTAPGGGEDAFPGSSAWDQTHCKPSRSGRAIWQQTFYKNPRDFQLVGFVGTSEAAPHAAAVAALVIASGRIGKNPSPEAVAARIRGTARDVGAPGRDTRYGSGLLNAAAAVADQ